MSDGVLLEYQIIGRYVRVAAIDSITHEEVVMIGDAQQSREVLARLAMRKLRYQQQKRQES
jgi:hypothetical protein